jgi:hypothetical protein
MNLILLTIKIIKHFYPQSLLPLPKLVQNNCHTHGEIKDDYGEDEDGDGTLTAIVVLTCSLVSL